MKRKLGVVLLLLCVLLCALSCRSGAPAPGTTAAPSSETEAPETEAPVVWHTIVADGASEYKILFPTGSSSAVVSAAQALRTAIREETGVRIDSENDEMPAWQTMPEDAPEILIGRTNRPESEAAYARLGDAADYVIELVGERIVIVGGTEAATLRALTLFREEYLRLENGTAAVPETLSVAVVSTAGVAGAALSADKTEFTFAIARAGGADLACRITYAGEAMWRLQSAFGGALDPGGAGQMLAEFLGETPYQTALPLTVSETESAWTLEAEGTRLVLQKEPFAAAVYTADGRTAAEVTYLSADDSATIVRGTLEENEAIWGTGERFNTVNQRGKLVEMTALDVWAGIEGNSYLPIPLLLSSRGTAMFMNRYERMTIDLGATEPSQWQITLPGAGADLYLMATETLSGALYDYSLLTGFAPEPAPWLYGTTVCRYAPDFSTAEGIYAMADAMEENDFPWDAVILEGWGAYSTSRWGELKTVVERLHEMGKKVLVYTTAGKTAGSALPDLYKVTRADNGSVTLPEADSYNPVDNPNGKTAQYVDITDPDAWNWWRGSLWDRLVFRTGVDGAKIDFCEQFPDFIDLIFKDGETSGAHHWYPTFYNCLMYRLFNEKEDGGMCFSRGGGIGAQRYPFIWAGDQKREFRYLAAQLRAVLSSGMSGVPFLSYDMAGYRPAANGDPEAQVFVRGVEFTAFSANIQTHGTVSRPYDFDAETKALYWTYSHVHEALRPYIEEQGRVSCATGVPLMRHLALEYWTDETVWNMDDEYLFGEALLVAPVLTSAVKRDVYLPAGTWISLADGAQYDGGQWLRGVDVPLGEIPVFIRAGHETPALREVLPAVRELLG